MNRKHVILGILILAVAAVILLPGQAKENKKKITVSGAWALYPMMVRWADEYQKVNPNVRVEVSAGGAGKGMTDALNSLVDIGMVSRDIDPTEVENGAYGIAVAKDAVIPTLNKNNPVAAEILAHGIKKKQFRDIFVSGNLTTWGEVVGRPEVNAKISVYVRADSCGAGEVWGKYLGGKQEDLVGIGVNADPGIAEAVSKDARGIGFNNLNFAYDDKTGRPVGNLVMAPIDLNDDGVLEENEDFYAAKGSVIAAILDGRYPSPPARDLYIVTKGRPTGAAGEFIRWILSDGQKYVPEAGYVQLKDEVLRGQLNKL